MQRVLKFARENNVKDFGLFLFVMSMGFELKMKRKELKALQDQIQAKLEPVTIPRGERVTML